MRLPCDVCYLRYPQGFKLQCYCGEFANSSTTVHERTNSHKHLDVDHYSCDSAGNYCPFSNCVGGKVQKKTLSEIRSNILDSFYGSCHSSISFSTQGKKILPLHIECHDSGLFIVDLAHFKAKLRNKWLENIFIIEM